MEETGMGQERLRVTGYLHPASGQPRAPPGTDLVEDVEVPLTGGLAGHASFL